MKPMTAAALVTIAMFGTQAASGSLAASAPQPTDPAAYLDAFESWAEANGGAASVPACHLPAADEPPFAVCYGVRGGAIVAAVIVVDETGAPGTVAPLPSPADDGLVDVTDSEPATEGSPTSFGPGEHEVGGDIVAGTYVAFVPPGGTCYWERVSGFSGELSDSIANGSADEGQLVIVAIDAADAGFTSDGCGTWTMLG